MLQPGFACATRNFLMHFGPDCISMKAYSSLWRCLQLESTLKNVTDKLSSVDPAGREESS